MVAGKLLERARFGTNEATLLLAWRPTTRPYWLRAARWDIGTVRSLHSDDHQRTGTEITVAEAGLERVAELAELNRQLRDDEGYPDPMTHGQLVERMTNWLQDGYRELLGLPGRPHGGLLPVP